MSQTPQYGIPAHEVKRLREEHALRVLRRQEYQRQLYDPNRLVGKPGHYIFNENVQRYQSTLHYHYNYFKPSRRSALWGIGLMLPFPILGYIIYKDRSTKEHSYRTGQVAYADRTFKFR